MWETRVEFCSRRWNDGDVALSDEEQRILREIEEQLQTDERFAQAVSPSGLYRHSARTMRWAILGVLAGLVVMVIALQIHFLLAFAGFLWMLGCALIIERQVRLIGKAGVQDIAQSLRGARAAGSSRLRDRFPRP
jgi:hypothetical protein